ncbi:MAG: APC family permease [Clostridiales Family XIII bacterium]|jgi:amino acid transporter|nr:APC family permease [Clostridiales Family XIII bacterium]
MAEFVKKEVTLKRAMGFWQSFGVAVGLVVAGTTMVSLAFSFGDVGPVFMLVAGIAGVGSILIALSYAELAAAIPGAGMIADYTMPAMGRSMSIFGVLTGYIVLITAGGACECFIAGQAAQALNFPDFGSVAGYKVFALLLLLLFLVINFLGVEWLGISQVILTVGMMAVLAVLGIGGLLGIGVQAEQIPVDFNPYGWGKVAMSMSAGIWLYIGIEYVCPMSEEIIKPEKTVPKAMICGVVTIFVCDMLFGEAIVRYTPLEVLVSSDVPQLVGAETMYGSFGVVALAIATIFAGGSSADSHMAAVPRMLYGLARDGMLPRIFAYLHPRFRTPWVAIGVVFLCMCVPFFIGLDITSIMGLIGIACAAWLMSYVIVQVDLIILRKKYPNLHRPFKSPAFPIPQIIGLIVCVYTIGTSGGETLLGVLPYLAVFAAYSILWVKFKMKEPCFKPIPITELTAVKVRFDDDAEGANA